MNKIINIANRDSSIKILNDFKTHKYVPFDVKIVNSGIKKINDFIGFTIFRKNCLYINSHTLWELMQSKKGKGSHNYHGLTPEDIHMAINALKNPKYVFVSSFGRYSIITVQLSHFSKPLIMVIEPNSSLILDINARINKIVTIYPKDNNSYVEKRWESTMLYKKPDAQK